MIIFGCERFGNPVDWVWPAEWNGTWKGEAVDRYSVGPSLGNPLERAMQVHFQRMPFGGVALLEAMGVPRGFIGKLCGGAEIGRVRCDIEKRSGLWTDGGGQARLVLAVRDEWGVLTDIVALASETPDEWALHTGSGTMLGRDRLARVRTDGEGRLRLFSTPIDWLRGEGDGICVLDWTKGALAELRALGPTVTLACEGREVADTLAQHLRWTGLPKVAADEARRVAA